MSDWGDFTLPLFGGVSSSSSSSGVSYGGVTSNGGYTASSTLNPQYAAAQNQLIKDQAQERQIQLQNMQQNQSMRTDVFGYIQKLLGIGGTTNASPTNASPTNGPAPKANGPSPINTIANTANPVANIKALFGSGPTNQNYAAPMPGQGGAGTPPVGGGGGGASPVGGPGTVGATDPNNPFQAGIDKIEAARTAEINRSSQEALNTSLARLQDRGLGGSTFALNAATGAERDKQSSLNDLSGQIGGLDIQGVRAGQQQQQSQIQLLMQLLNGTGGGGQMF